MTHAHTLYIALGDSMSIDRYPSLDAEERGLGLQVLGAAGSGERPLGAASLLQRNADWLWPEFAGCDLASRCPGGRALCLAVDGATTKDVLDSQLPRARRQPWTERPLITLTVGGNDLLAALVESGTGPALARAVQRLRLRYSELVQAICLAFPNARLVLTTVYDPTDGTGVLPGISEIFGTLPLQHLETLNDHIRVTAGTTRDATVADAHSHFLGHGVTTAPASRWYWQHSLIEPNLAGASEIRRCWSQALGGLE